MQQPPLHLMRKIESLCTQFEAEFQRGERPELSQYLQQVEAAHRETLFFELLCIELNYRRLEGHAPEPEDYCPQYSDYEPAILSAFEETTVQQLETIPLPADFTPADQTSKSLLTPGGTFAGHSLIKQLGRGGMGEVYLAKQPQTGRQVALKVMRREMLRDDETGDNDAMERFCREARALARVAHPNIVSIFEAGEHEGQPYFSMEYVAGGSLRQKLNDGPLDVRQAARYAMQAAEGLQAAHENDLVHRDVSPGNVLIDEATGIARVSDFGLAKISGEPSQTATGAVFGSPYYMAPEQVADASRAGHAADVYSLGATLYHALTGRPPFQTATVMDTLLQVVREEPAAPRSLNAAIPRDLENICRKCLHKEPARRYDSAASLAQDLQNFLQGKPVLARPISWTERCWRSVRRNPLPAALGGVAVLTLVIGAVVSAAFAFEASKQAGIARAEKDRAVLALKDANKQRELAIQQKEIATVATAEAVQQRKLAEHQLQIARKSAANQLRLYIQPSRLAGEIATAPDVRTANARMRSLTAGATSVSNQKLAAAIQAVKAAIEADPQQFESTPLDQRLQMPAALAARRLSQAAHATWQRECDAYFGNARSGRPAFLPAARQPGDLPANVVELEYEILTTPLYKTLAVAVSKIQAPLPADADTKTQRSYERSHRQFWTIYWGELVFAGTPDVLKQAAAFAEILANGPADARIQEAQKLIALCQKFGA